MCRAILSSLEFPVLFFSWEIPVGDIPPDSDNSKTRGWLNVPIPLNNLLGTKTVFFIFVVAKVEVVNELVVQRVNGKGSS